MTIVKKQCGFSIKQLIKAPLEVVWSLVSQFHNPKSYKLFIRSSTSASSSNTIGSYRNIIHATGFPATTSIERLDELDNNIHMIAFSLVGGDHSRRLANYHGTITLLEDGDQSTMVTEKYYVDVSEESNEKDTRFFVDTLVRLNLRSLARIAEHISA